MLNLSPNELKLITKSGDIKDYENKSEDDLMNILSEPKIKISLSKKKIWMNRGNKLASWNDKLDLEVYFWFYNIG